MQNRSTLLSRIYRLKLLFIGALLVILGLLNSTLTEWMKGLDAPNLVIAVVDGLASVFLVTGAIGIAVDFFTGRDKEEADAERLHLAKTQRRRPSRLWPVGKSGVFAMSSD